MGVRPPTDEGCAALGKPEGPMLGQVAPACEVDGAWVTCDLHSQVMGALGRLLAWGRALCSTQPRCTRSRIVRKDKPMAITDILKSRLGFGAAPLGNMFRAIPEDEALATVEAAWNDGIRYFDNAPFYGAGLAEIRMGRALGGRPRDEYVISTKVGRIGARRDRRDGARQWREGRGLQARPAEQGRQRLFGGCHYRSIEDSLKRLNTDHIDIAFVHDIAQDFYGDEWLGKFEEARKGAFRALDRMRDEGVIKAWGIGVNRVEPIEVLLDLAEPRPDVFLLAGRYTLLDHDRALERLVQRVSGARARHRGRRSLQFGRAGWRAQLRICAPTPPSLAKVAAIKALADRHGIP